MTDIITRGQPKTCAGRPEVKIGDTWNYLYIIAEAKSIGLGRRVRCRCECGKIKIYSAHHIRRGAITSCGLCSRKIRPVLPYRRRSKYDSKTAAIRSLFTSYKSKAKEANRVFTLTFEQFCAIIASPCTYCGKPPYNEYCRNRRTTHETHRVTCRYTGIDRVNNRQGYTSENSLPCCETCNRAKLKMTLPEFKLWVTAVYKHLKL